MYIIPEEKLREIDGNNSNDCNDDIPARELDIRLVAGRMQTPAMTAFVMHYKTFIFRQQVYSHHRIIITAARGMRLFAR